MTDRIVYDTPLLVLPHSPEHLELSRSINIIKDENNWLEDAVPFNIYNANSKRLRELINSIFAEVLCVIPTPNRQRYRDVLKRVLINLWNGYYRGKPVRYSRDTTYYTRNSMYGKQFIKYDRLIPVIDALETLGYIEQRNGVWNKEREIGRTTRMWATFKLWRQFRTFNLKKNDFFSVERPVNTIVLRDGEEHNKEVRFTYTPAIRRLRDDVESYNDFLDQHDITVNLSGPFQVKTEYLVNMLYKGILNNTIEVDSIKLYTKVGSIYSFNTINKPIIQQFSSNIKYTSHTINQYTVPFHLIHNTMTHRILPDALVFFGFKGLDQSKEMLNDYLADLSLSISLDTVKDRRKARLAEEYPLKDIGVDRLVLRLRKEYIHRVFNRNSFKLGGRAYGAIHQRMPRNHRPYVYIDGQPTVELDYSAYHIRMLYHQEHIDYRDDPYVVCEGPKMRDTYKVVGLVSINAKNQQSAYGGIRDELNKNGIPKPAGEKPFVRLVNRFKETHPRIAKYICSDRGVHLMNIDSKIMNAILVRLMDQGILGLSVYDSIIVAEQHQDCLNQLMIDEYKKEMGFNPIVDMKKKP
ncbi:MAG: hypothetical protein HGJ94_09095 [Desulfosarcina sp.]|nr:hypothetical protein [Desulfosarcina sp.]